MENRTNRRTITLIVGWFVWTGVALASFSNVLPNLPGLLLTGVVWLPLAILSVIRRNHSVLVTAAGAMFLGGIALITNWDLAVRIALSQSSLQAYVNNDGDAPFPSSARRIGLFKVRYVDRYEHATLFATQSVFLEDYGIAFVPDGRPPTDATGMFRFWRIYGNWYGYEWDG